MYRHSLIGRITILQFSCDFIKFMFEIEILFCTMDGMIMSVTAEPEKPLYYTCKFCSRYCLSEEELEAHENGHVINKRLICPVCKMGFVRRSYLAEHMYIHKGKQPYMCTYCEKSFSLKCNLVRHVRIHTGDKPFTCKICTQSFTLKKNMLEHMRTHTGERPFLCPKCTRTFSRRSSLIRHIRIHSGEKAYQCSQCNKSFSWKYYLKRHIKIHLRDCKTPRKRRTKAEIALAKAEKSASQVLFISVPKLEPVDVELHSEDSSCSIEMENTYLPVTIGNIKIEESEEACTPCQVIFPSLVDGGIEFKDEGCDNVVSDSYQPQKAPEVEVTSGPGNRRLIVDLPRML